MPIHLFRNCPRRYESQLNERGEGLSLGQKQLLVMARTFAQQPEMLFVLDEATASIDTATELLIQDALEKLMQNRTSIVIAHRLFYDSSCRPHSGDARWRVDRLRQPR